MTPLGQCNICVIPVVQSDGWRHSRLTTKCFSSFDNVDHYSAFCSAYGQMLVKFDRFAFQIFSLYGALLSLKASRKSYKWEKDMEYGDMEIQCMAFCFHTKPFERFNMFLWCLKITNTSIIVMLLMEYSENIILTNI